MRQREIFTIFTIFTRAKRMLIGRTCKNFTGVVLLGLDCYLQLDTSHSRPRHGLRRCMLTRASFPKLSHASAKILGPTSYFLATVMYTSHLVRISMVKKMNYTAPTWGPLSLTYGHTRLSTGTAHRRARACQHARHCRRACHFRQAARSRGFPHGTLLRFLQLCSCTACKNSRLT